MTTLPDFTEAFAACRTIVEADALYKTLHREYVGEFTYPMSEAYTPLSEAHRQAMIRMTVEARIEALPHDPNRVRPHELRNWCRVQGIALAKHGKVSAQIENQYREAHNMDLLEVKPPKEPRVPREVKVPKVRVAATGADPKVVRAWAQSQGIVVGSRGRIDSIVISKYLAEFGA